MDEEELICIKEALSILATWPTGYNEKFERLKKKIEMVKTVSEGIQERKRIVDERRWEELKPALENQLNFSS